jgi:hypothetical protein
MVSHPPYHLHHLAEERARLMGEGMNIELCLEVVEGQQQGGAT